MTLPLSSSAQRIQDELSRRGFSHQVKELDQTTPRAAAAWAALGCEVAQIAKSLVFRRRQSGRPLLVIASGANRVNEKQVGRLVGEPIERADADFVRQVTGFSIGGVPPLGHKEALEVVIDEDLLQYSLIWAAAGTPNAVFGLDPAELPRLTGGQVTSIR